MSKPTDIQHDRWWMTYNTIFAAFLAQSPARHGLDQMHVLSAKVASTAHGFIPDSIGDGG